MARGGSRPGAGRPRKGEPKPVKVAVQAAAEKLATGDPDVSTPLAFLLSVMGNPLEELKIRVQCASIAAPYVHAKRTDTAPGKKQEAEGRSRTAEAGTSWDGLLQ